MRALALTLAALLAASAIFVAIVLPAEFGADPTGAGEALGLVGLAGQDPVDVHRTERALIEDARAFELAPFESVELKYHLAAGDGLVYAWSATAEVVFDLHAEPEGAPEEAAQSFAQGRGVADGGAYVAGFDGVHGWFWENRGFATVVVELRAAGFFGGATRYAGGREERVLDAPGSAAVSPASQGTQGNGPSPADDSA